MVFAESTYPTPKLAPIEQPKAPRKTFTREGYVYLLRTLHDPTSFKIGRTKDPNDRVKTFKTKFPFKVQYVCLIYTQDMYQLEKELHHRFDNQRTDGEFFKLSPADVNYIKGLST